MYLFIYNGKIIFLCMIWYDVYKQCQLSCYREDYKQMQCSLLTIFTYLYKAGLVHIHVYEINNIFVLFGVWCW